MMLPSTLLHGRPDRIVAAMLILPKDEWHDTIFLHEFLSGRCPFHSFDCGDSGKHRREFERHYDAHQRAVRDRFGWRSIQPQDLRIEPRVGLGSMSGHHVVYFKLDMNGYSFRSGRVLDLDQWDDYDGTRAWDA